MFLKNRRLPGIPKVIVETSIHFARLLANDTQGLLTWKPGIKLIWQDWDLGIGSINRRIQKGDLLLVRGKWYNVYILVVYDVKSPEWDPNKPLPQQMNQMYEFQTVFTGIIWNRMTYKLSRTW